MKKKYVILSILSCLCICNGYGIVNCGNINASAKLDRSDFFLQSHLVSMSGSHVFNNLTGINFDNYYFAQENGTLAVNLILNNSGKTENKANDVLMFLLGAEIGHLSLCVAYGIVLLFVNIDANSKGVLLEQNIPIWMSAAYYATIPIGSIIGGYLFSKEEVCQSPWWLTTIFAYVPSVVGEVMLYYFITEKWDNSKSGVLIGGLTFLENVATPILATLGFLVGKCIFTSKANSSSKILFSPFFSIRMPKENKMGEVFLIFDFQYKYY